MVRSVGVKLWYRCGFAAARSPCERVSDKKGIRCFGFDVVRKSDVVNSPVMGDRNSTIDFVETVAVSRCTSWGYPLSITTARPAYDIYFTRILYFFPPCFCSPLANSRFDTKAQLPNSCKRVFLHELECKIVSFAVVSVVH